MSNDKKAASTSPVAKVQVRTVKGSIWARSTDRNTFYSATFQNGYRDGDGNWKNGHSYDLDGLLALQHAVGLAIDRVLALRAADVSDTPETPADLEEEIAV